MEIKQDFPQFEDKRSLLVVSWESRAKYYYVHKGHLEMIDEFAVADPSIQLQDDYVKDTKMQKSWSMPEHYKQYIQQKLLHRISEDTKDIHEKHRITETYLFCIWFMANAVYDCLTPTVRSTVKYRFTWDMNNHHPFELLEMIKIKNEEIAEKNEFVAKI